MSSRDYIKSLSRVDLERIAETSSEINYFGITNLLGVVICTIATNIPEQSFRSLLRNVKEVEGFNTENLLDEIEDRGFYAKMVEPVKISINVV